MRNVIRKQWANDEGMSLVEIMIAIFVLSVGLLALGSTVLSSIVSLRVSRGRQEATDAASALIEDLRRTDYTSVALDATDVGVTDFVSTSGGCDPTFDEPLVTTSQGTGIPREQSFGPSGRITVRTSVSWYDDGVDDLCSDPDHDRKVKRVQVVAEYRDADRLFTVEESTLVAPVDRGLPAPDFRVGSPEASLVLTQEDKAVEREHCIGHLLRNLGAEDTYKIDVTRTDGTGVKNSGDVDFYSPPGDPNKWTIRAFFAHPPQDPPVDPSTLSPAVERTHAGGDITPELELLADAIGDGDELPDQKASLETGEEGRLWVCYRPGANLSVPTTAAFQVTVYSQFDPNRFETLTHDLSVTNEFTYFHLFDDYVPDSTPTEAEASTNRVVGTGGNARLPVLQMGRITELEPRKLGATTALPNYDVDFDTYPGTRLLNSARRTETSPIWPAGTIVFHEQISPARLFDDSLQLQLWSAPDAALAAQATGTTPTPVTVQLRVRLQVLRHNENNVEATLIDFTDGVLAYSHTTAGFEVRNWGLTVPGGDFTIAKDQYLRLEIMCDPATGQACHLAYDHLNYPSHLRLQARS